MSRYRKREEEKTEVGVWIPIPYQLDYETDAECSLCHEQFIAALNYNFCPNCGSIMTKPKFKCEGCYYSPGDGKNYGTEECRECLYGIKDHYITKEEKEN